MGGGLPRRGERLLRVHDHRGRRPRSDRSTACRSCSASAASTTSPSARCRTCAGGGTAAPVRVGNGAWDQRQIDVYGELLGAAHRLADQLRRPRRRHPAVPRRAAPTRPPTRWTEQGPGHLGGARRAAALPLLQGDVLGRARPGDRPRRPARREPTASTGWKRTREEIWHDRPPRRLERRGRRVHPVVRLRRPRRVEPDDGRSSASCRPTTRGCWPPSTRSRQRLTDERGLVYRYRTADGVDGLAGEEGTFLLCTFWLAQALALAGQVDRARAVFERAAAFVNDVGLLAEEVDPSDRRAARQLPAGLQPHRPGQRGLGDLPGAGRACWSGPEPEPGPEPGPWPLSATAAPRRPRARSATSGAPPQRIPARYAERGCDNPAPAGSVRTTAGHRCLVASGGSSSCTVTTAS